MTIDLPESRVIQIWQDCAGRDDLETEDDGPVRVLYPGRTNDSGGADFRDAVIQTGRGLLTGDIEIHSKSSLWRAHRHHLDPLYNRVVLHVVYRHDTAKPVMLQNGQAVSTLALQKLDDTPRSAFSPPVKCACPGKIEDPDSLPDILDMAGERRFQARAAGFQAVSSPEEAGQALYRGIMAALGYAQNKHQMAELAGRMPLRRLESMVMAEITDLECPAACQAILLGTAGLLPSQRGRPRTGGPGDARISRLEKIWSAAGEAITMRESDWQFFRVRPGNFPTRRIAAMSRLLAGYRRRGLLDGLMNKLDEVTADGNVRELEDALTVGAGDEWGESGGKEKPGQTALLGKNRAADIIINVLLPFAAAWGRLNSRPELASKAAALFHCYPPVATNTIERHMSRQLGLDGKLVNTARRQQGILHIFKTYCSAGLCRDCPVKRAV